MRLLISGFFILLSGCSFMTNAGDGKDMKTVSKENYEDYNANVETKIETFDDLYIVMHYPETPNDQIDQTLLDYVNEQRSDFKKESYGRVQGEGVSAVQELHIGYDVIHEDPETYVVKFKETVTWGEGREKSDETIFHFGKSNGKRLSLQHFLEGEQERNELQNLVENDLNYKIIEQDLENFIYEGDTLTFFIGGESVKVEKEEHPGWFTDRFRTKYAEDPEPPENYKQRDKSIEVPVTKEMAEDYPVVVMGGPHPERTEELLRILEKNDAKAMFYMIGKRAERYPEVVKEVEEAGHVVVAHTWNHRMPKRLSVEEKEKYRERSVELISSITDQEEVFVSTGDVNPGQALENRENWKDEPKAWVMKQMQKSVDSRGQLIISELNVKSPKLLEEILPRMGNTPGEAAARE
ncbi:polysaccharide deacetylase family protein [Salimicrobium flavidum]|uniref:Polysaccharide deacetylase n=1 Tax=Salimicrobium flavidum TaxID=570947 RepID=A0A1N7IUD5_9BACI|nr:polysaccharide deacetylase family protein [Salimicrobium flavidum]SIS40581.1 Polysaccharide deacetylase [Salimicrobium flavidum]